MKVFIVPLILIVGVLGFSSGALAHQGGGRVVEEAPEAVRCLTMAVYFEARSEPREGQFAVAEVVLNRVRSSRYPNTVCGVVTQGNWRGCQFSFWCDGLREVYRSQQGYRRALYVAQTVLSGKYRPFLPRRTLFYHNTTVLPKWARTGETFRLRQIGRHVFYQQ